MAAAPPRAFGVRQVQPMPVQAPAPRVTSAVLQAATRYWQDFQARFAALLPLVEARIFTWVSLLLLRLGSLSLPQPSRFLRRGARSLATALRRNEARSHRAAVRALLWSDAKSTFVRLLAYIGALAVLAGIAVHLVAPAPSAVAIDPAPVAEWMTVAKPFPAFSLPLSEFGDNGPDYALRRHVAGGGRQDILTWGELKGATPHLMVEIYRPGSELSRFRSAEREIAVRLDGTGASTARLAGEMQTKFGSVALVEFSFGNPARQCLGFARIYRDPQLQILGWHCRSGAAIVERGLIACALDRLSLLAAGSEPKLRELFARAELRRNFCGQRTHLMTPTPKLGPSAPPPELRYRRLTAG
jgi:hypothetical protein